MRALSAASPDASTVSDRGVYPRGMAEDLSSQIPRVAKDGATWRLGEPADVAWISDHTEAGLAITSAIPPVFDAYATIVIPDDQERLPSERALLKLLTDESDDQPWWLGYLDTGASDVVFPDAPRVSLYAGWPYVLVRAGARQAAKWRTDSPFRGTLPDLMFPSDHAWSTSRLWDDDWYCIGGPRHLVHRASAEPALRAHSVGTDENATPPGHTAR